MKFLHFNILNGFENDLQKFDLFRDYLTHNEYDFISINEFRKNQLSEELKKIGFDAQIVNEFPSNLNKVAVFSKIKFEPVFVSRKYRYIHIRFGNLDAIAYHASPQGVLSVLEEVHEIVQIDGENTIIFGDFNSLCRADFTGLNLADFSGESMQRYMLDGALNFDALDRLSGHGYKDTNVSKDSFTVPTGVTRKVEGGKKLRLDYCLMKSQAYTGQSEVLRDPIFQTLSDHFPLSIRIERKNG